MSKNELLLLDWMRKVHQLEYAHCYQSLFFSRLEKIVGLGAFILTTTVAFTYRFPFIEAHWIKEYALPSITFIVAILTGYQAFIKPGEKAEIHRKLGIEYEKIRHDIEPLYVLASAQPPSDLDKKIDGVRAKWNSLNTMYVNEKYYSKAKEKVKSFAKYPKELGFISND